MKFLLKLSQGIDAINGWVARVILLVTLAMVFLGAYNALTRVVDRELGTRLVSNTWLELNWYMFAAVFLLIAGYTLLHNGHVRVDVFYTRMHPRRQAWVNILGAVLVVIPLSLFVIYVSIPWVAGSIGWFAPGGRWEMSTDPGGLLRWPVRVIILPGFALLALQALSEAIKNYAFLRGVIPAPRHDTIGKVVV